ncbi:hypothetical protein FB45DRAFT_1131921 [Roridomyces roridus]|uniref:sn-1-specific diacylglycerol lipase n=1 Tax=Roridomyces roridus TaxID=1738132 RepID=A0AAD7C3P1_9AGAR|nr:hypothetical protein FB45DRAFT_1131921 [Roridomyces roridus]
MWDVYSRQGLDLASYASALTFSAVKTTTRLGFRVASTAVDVTATAVDWTLFGGSTIARPIAGGVISFAEQIALAPIFFSEYITSTSLLAAHSSINLLTAIIPGSSEASFSLSSFITLVRRELNEPAAGESLPENWRRFGLTQMARAIVAWVALQGVTQEWDEKRWLKHMREIHFSVAPAFVSPSDVIFPNNRGQLIVADIGEASVRAHSSRTPRMTYPQLKTTLRRLSKLVLAGYGGASLLFFGAAEEANLTHAIDASEAEAAGDFPPLEASAGLHDPQYSWWDVLLGKHDQEIFERYANTPVDKADAEIKEKMRATAKIGSEHLMPRFWVLTDHPRGEIVLVLRGTMSLNEIAVDLTCDDEEFEPATTTASDDDMPGQFVFPSLPFPGSSGTQTRHHAHSGMLRMARAMGGVGKPVHLAVHEALLHNPNYQLVLCGHSLGAGVAGLLGLMWADPQNVGLPVGRRVSVYCFAPPDLGAAAMWLCDGNEPKDGRPVAEQAGSTAVTSRAKQWKTGAGTPDDPNWFISVRKTLEANMKMSITVPPGRVLWAMRDNDFSPAHRQTANSDSAPDKLRLFEVLDVEKVFSQIVFARDMLSSHLPDRYDSAAHELL